MRIRWNVMASNNRQDDIYDLFAKKGIRASYAMIYLALSGCLIGNTKFAKASYPVLRKKGRVSSDATVCRALNELEEKGFISRMGNSMYLMKIGHARWQLGSGKP